MARVITLVANLHLEQPKNERDSGYYRQGDIVVAFPEHITDLGRIGNEFYLTTHIDAEDDEDLAVWDWLQWRTSLVDGNPHMTYPYKLTHEVIDADGDPLKVIDNPSQKRVPLSRFAGSDALKEGVSVVGASPCTVGNERLVSGDMLVDRAVRALAGVELINVG